MEGDHRELSLELQVCNLCAPLLVGQLLYFTTYLTTALVVAG